MEGDHIELPLEIIQYSPGCALDIGGSVAKVVYRSKDEFTNGIPNNPSKVNSGKGSLHLAMFPREKLDDAIRFLKENCDMDKSGGKTAKGGKDKTEIVTTGMGGMQFQKKIEDALNVRVINQLEMDCFVTSLNFFLTSIPHQDLFMTLDKEGIKCGEKIVDHHRYFMSAIANKGKGNVAYKEYKAPPSKPAVSYPYLLVMCGSAFKFIKVEKDGTYLEAVHSSLGGRCFLGLISYLTDIQDFAEISKAIKNSDGKTVDTNGLDLLPPGADGLPGPPPGHLSGPPPNVFPGPPKIMPGSLAGPPMGKPEDLPRLFPMGRGLTQREKATKGDLIHSLVETFCENLATLTHLICQNNNLTHALFCGNFITTPKVQRFLTREMYFRKYQPGSTVEWEFIKNGGHLGALGAYIEAHTRCQRNETRL